jgi:hypothetical protein
MRLSERIVIHASQSMLIMITFLWLHLAIFTLYEVKPVLSDGILCHIVALVLTPVIFCVTIGIMIGILIAK